jgi:hypothetical protein
MFVNEFQPPKIRPMRKNTALAANCPQGIRSMPKPIFNYPMIWREIEISHPAPCASRWSPNFTTRPISIGITPASLKPSGSRLAGRVAGRAHAVVLTDTIGPGVKISEFAVVREGAIVGAGSVVTKDVESYAVVMGVPARLTRGLR